MRNRPEYSKKQIGKNLRRCRQAKQLSVEQVRQYLHLGSIQAIYKWEEGRSYPQTDTMFALMELYEIGLPELLRENEKEAEMKVVRDSELAVPFLLSETVNSGWMNRIRMYYEYCKRIWSVS